MPCTRCRRHWRKLEMTRRKQHQNQLEKRMLKAERANKKRHLSSMVLRRSPNDLGSNLAQRTVCARCVNFNYSYLFIWVAPHFSYQLLCPRPVISSTTSTALYGRPRQSTHSYPLLTCLLLGSGVLLRLYRGQRGAFPMPSGKSQATFLSEGGVGVGRSGIGLRSGG